MTKIVTMSNNLIEELKVLVHKILNEDKEFDLDSGLDQVRSLYEQLLIERHIRNSEVIQENTDEEVPVKSEISDEAIRHSAEAINEVSEVIDDIPEATHNEPFVISQASQDLQDNKDDNVADAIDNVADAVSDADQSVAKDDNEEEAPLSLNDLFIPTFEGIKEDMSLKAEFKDTVSLDDTENLFQVKKEPARQLSLNDKLLGNSIQVGLNDRIAFVNKLFNFSQSDFNKVLSKLNDCHTHEEALKYFQYQVKPNYNWKGKEDLEERFVSLIERKFL